jgi:hypothetical protein
MDLKNIRIPLPKNWGEISRMGEGNQVVVRIYHINPLAKIKPEDRQDRALESNNPNVTITKISPQTAGANPLTDFYSGMKSAIESGFMPPEMTMEKLNNLWNGLTATPHAEMPPESDITGDIGITEFPDESTAYQMLKNQTMGFVQEDKNTIMGGISIPGINRDSTIEDYEKNDVLKKMMTKEQFLGILEINKIQKQEMPKIREDFKKTGMKYIEKTFLGCKAIFSEIPNPTPPPKKPVKSKEHGMGGSRGNHIAAALPKVDKFDKYSATLTGCLGLVCGKYLISGTLVSFLNFLPSGNASCHSLTKTKEVVSKMTEGGTTFTDIALVPIASTYAEEGYPTKEDIEKIFTNVISLLK